MTHEGYVLGNGVQVYGDFVDQDQNPVDPSVITLVVRAPDGTESVLTWPPDGTIVREALGTFHYAFVPDQEGNWRYQWKSSTPAAAIEGDFRVFSAFTSGPDSSYTYDLSTAVGKVRLYIDDRDMTRVSAALPLEQRSAIFADEEISQFLAVSSNEPLYASALALITIANNRNLMVQRRSLSRTTVDFGGLRGDLLRQADALRKQATEMGLGPAAPADGIAEVIYDDFGLRRVIVNHQLRSDGLSNL